MTPQELKAFNAKIRTSREEFFNATFGIVDDNTLIFDAKQEWNSSTTFAPYAGKWIECVPNLDTISEANSIEVKKETSKLLGKSILQSKMEINFDGNTEEIYFTPVMALSLLDAVINGLIKPNDSIFIHVRVRTVGEDSYVSFDDMSTEESPKGSFISKVKEYTV